MNIYVGATRQNDGKTITCLGLISALKKRIDRVGYIKPVGQRYVEIKGHKIDEDSLLVKLVYNLEGAITDMSPIAVPRHFTEKYIDNPNREKLVNLITTSYERIAATSDIVVVEGTGHAGVGSVFDMPNGDVAFLLGCKALIVASGGIGRPIDEIMLNKAMFDAAGVPILGVIINKVDEAKYDKIKDYVTRGLARKDIDVLGVMPYKPMLSNPTMGQILEDIEGELLNNTDGMHNIVGKTVIGAMPPDQASEYFNSDALIITPGTREDLILAAIYTCTMGDSTQQCLAGMILTGETPPQPSIIDLIAKTPIPVMMFKEDTYTVASKIAKIIVKIRPGDSEKIRVAETLVSEFVDVDRLLNKLTDS
ncbi:MAG: AAA family ATPase [Armatimonadetes bacterium]|nr:AAA family ATPase [Armatimonadota bacterium]